MRSSARRRLTARSSNDWTLSGTPLVDVEAAIAAWRDGEPSSLVEVMRAVGAELGQAISARLNGSTVSHLFISPVSVLHGVPMCLLETGPGQLLGDKYSISYAPSARLLQSLTVRGRLTGLDLVATAYHDKDDIPLTSTEIALVGSLYKDPTLLLRRPPHRSACWTRRAPEPWSTRRATAPGASENTYASGLHLAPSPGDAGGEAPRASPSYTAMPTSDPFDSLSAPPVTPAAQVPPGPTSRTTWASTEHSRRAAPARSCHPCGRLMTSQACCSALSCIGI